MLLIIAKILYKLNQIKKRFQKNKSHINDSLTELHFTIIITSYNNKKYCEKNLESVLKQHYKNYNVIYIDDFSTDNTETLVKNYLDKYDKNNICSYIRNKKRSLKLKNLYKTIHNLPDNEIIIELDGDDYFAHSKVLKIINTCYQETNAIFIHTCYYNNPKNLAKKMKLETFSHKTPWIIKKYGLFRKYPWIYSGIRTYYAWLFKKIKKENLICKTEPYANQFFPVSHDLAVTYPLLEMTSSKISYISDPLLIRNVDSNINDFKKYDDRIRVVINKDITSQKRYDKIC